jgi:SAM-dependent methyltransferase
VLTGVDASSTAVAYARANAERAAAPVEFAMLDVLHDPLPAGFDVVTTSLFLHHLDDMQAVALLEKMGRAAQRLVLVNDLARCRLGYLAAWLGTRVLSRSPIVHVDGPRSVEAAFTLAEAQQLAEAAGLHGASVAWRWPWRFLLTWECSR